MSLHAPLVTELDAARIREMAARAGNAPSDELDDLVEMVSNEAQIVPVPRVPPDVVTVNTRLTFRDELTGSVHTVTVVYPQDFSIAERRISVLSPVGRALLGRRVGSSVPIALPGGITRRITILQVHYQPEAAGDTLR
jgi:regulator of nucleoside diphosphate kinase